MEEEKENKAYVSFRASVDVAMGVLYVFISVYCMLLPAILEQYGRNYVYILGGLFSFYGLFRFVRGLLKFKKAFLNKPTRRSFPREDSLSNQN
jgi:hypothetical protein